MTEPNALSLRERQKASTRELILETAMALFLRVEGAFSHEAIAERAGMSARTVYRHFPTQAELYRALWERHREETATRFPTSVAELLPQVHTQFRQFEEHAALIRAVLSSPVSAEVLAHGWREGHAAFQRALSDITAGLSPEHARWLVAVCQAIYSAPFWQMLRTRGQLSGDEAADAAAWVMEVVIAAARKGAFGGESPARGPES